MLEERDGDGRFERSAVFAEHLTPSTGLGWHNHKLFVADPPDLVALEDADDHWHGHLPGKSSGIASFHARVVFSR